VRATQVNEEMKMAATRALAALAKEDVPESVSRLYGLRSVKFGPDYLIPFAFDPRVLLWVAPAVAWAAVASGVAKEMIDLESYREQLEARLGRARGIMRGIINRAVRDPKRVVFPEGEEPKIIRAARMIVDEGIGSPILLGQRDTIERLAEENHISLRDILIEDPAKSDKRDKYADYLWRRRQRKGLSHGEAHQLLFNGNYFGSCMVACGDADALLSGVGMHYPETIRPALQVIGAHPKAEIVSGLYMLVFEKHVIFCGDTTVNIDPTAEQLAQIAYSAGRIVRTFGITPKIAMLSFSNFGSVTPSRSGEGGESRSNSQKAGSFAHRRRRDAGRHGHGREHPSLGLPVQRAERARKRADISQLERGEYRLQAAASSWGSGQNRAFSGGYESSRTRA